MSGRRLAAAGAPSASHVRLSGDIEGFKFLFRTIGVAKLAETAQRGREQLPLSSTRYLDRKPCKYLESCAVQPWQHEWLYIVNPTPSAGFRVFKES